MNTDIGIDLGTGFTRIYHGRSVVLNEPSVVAVKSRSGEPVAFGKEAYSMIGRTSGRIVPVSPISRGTIADFDVAELMITEYMQRILGKKTVKPRVMITMPSGITAVQQRSLLDVLESAGARSVCTIEGPLAAAINTGVDFSTPHGVTVVDIGKGTTDIAVLSLNGLAQCESAKVAGADFDEAIVHHVRREHNVDIGYLTAERIKMQIGCVMPRPVEVGMTVSGLNLFTGLPQSIEVNTTEICAALTEPAEAIVSAIQGVFERTAPELVADTARDGMILTGGGALIYGMEQLLSERLLIKPKLVENPQNCVINGIGKALADFKFLKKNHYAFWSQRPHTVE